MILRGIRLAEKLRAGDMVSRDGIILIPRISDSRKPNDYVSSVDLRLGRWFISLRPSRAQVIDLCEDDTQRDREITKYQFVPFGQRFIVHPGRFVLGSTLEWIRLPDNISAYITGKSSLGRRGLIIETAAGVHPGFSGCLVLEIANVGEAPIIIKPGMQICQLFFHTATQKGNANPGHLSGHRRPSLGRIGNDEVLKQLSQAERLPRSG